MTQFDRLKTAPPQLAPIALFVHRRPEHTRRALSSLRDCPEARDSDLVVFADAARKPEHEAGVRAVRGMLGNIEGFRSVEIVARDQNLGLARSIADGVTRLCRDHGRVIVVEDDLVVAPQFLAFLNRGLDDYADAENVFQVSGYMYPGDYAGAADALFLPMVSCWGWATWARAWQHYDSTLKGFERIAADPVVKDRFNLHGAYDYFARAEQQRQGAIDSWGICWHLSAFLRDGLTLYPRRTLVRNDGFDASGTHGAGNDGLHSALWQPDVGIPDLQLPVCITADKDGMAKVEMLLRAQVPTRVASMIASLSRSLKSRSLFGRT